jgi:DNA-binding transcriptional LysR family regulator
MQITANPLDLARLGRTQRKPDCRERCTAKTQPAVSAQLKQLAAAVGAPLVTRHRYGVTLTAAGETLLPYAQACVRAIEGAEQATQRLRGVEEGRLSILASTSVAVYMLPAALAAFHSRFPGIELRIARHNAEDAMKQLASGDGDVAVVRGSPPIDAAANLVTRVLMADETLLVVTRGHPLARRRRLQPEELDGIEIVDRESTSATRALIERIAARAGIKFRVKFQTVGVEALKEAVQQGFGAGFMSRLAVRREVEAGILAAIPIDAPELTQHITIAYPTLGQCSPAVPKFVEIIDATYRGASRRQAGRARP